MSNGRNRGSGRGRLSCRRRAPRGFTLAEAIISITILGMMGAMVAGTFGRALDARDQAEAISSHYHQVRQAMLRMVREIQMAYISEHRDCDDPRTKTLFRGAPAANGMRLDFTSFSHFKMVADANVSDQNELSYFVIRNPDPDPDADYNQMVLMRREQAPIDEDPDEGGLEQVLAYNVKSLEFEFYNPKEDRWEDEWDTEDSDFKGRLPIFVSIRMKVLDPDGKTEEFVTKTRVFLRRSLKLPGGIPCLD